MISSIKNFFKSKNESDYSQKINKLELLGKVYHKKIGSAKKEISMEASLKIQINNQESFEYSLIMKNEDSDDIWQLKKFNMTNDLSLKLLSEQKIPHLIWNQDRDFYIFMILNDQENERVLPEFLHWLSTLVCSYEYEIHPSSVKKEDSNEYIFISEIENIDEYLDDNYLKYYNNDKNQNANNFNINSVKINEEPEDELININKITEKLGKKMDIKAFSFIKANPKAKQIFQASGLLLRYDQGTDDLEEVCSKALFIVYKLAEFEYFIAVDDIDNIQTFTSSQISQEMNLVINNNQNCLLWIGKDSNVVNAYNFIFENKNKLEELKKLLTKSQYEANNHNNFDELNEEDRKWLENVNNCDLDATQNSIIDIEMELETDYLESETGGVNRVSTQAYLHDRTFVVRQDNVISVYRSDEDHTLKHLMDLPPLKKFEGKDINIMDAKMFLSDSNMLLMDSFHPSSAYRYDLSKGKIVEEWDCGDKNIIDLCMEKKLDQMEDNPIVNAFDSNNLFCLDSRIDKKNKIVMNKNYKTKTRFSCFATTGFGGLAVGSQSGEIRLYKDIGKNAKTLLPSLGDPIKSIDVTYDGKWILATCDKYLMVICTICKGKCTGFDVQMGKEKPYPKILKVDGIDIKKNSLEKFSFTPARFNVTNTQETNIITSLGDFIINWNFAKVKKGVLDDYKIKRAYQNIYDNKFKYNSDQIIVTMQNKLRVQKQKIN